MSLCQLQSRPLGFGGYRIGLTSNGVLARCVCLLLVVVVGTLKGGWLPLCSAYPLYFR